MHLLSTLHNPISPLLTSLLTILTLNQVLQVPLQVHAVPQTTGNDSFLNYNIFVSQIVNATNFFRRQHNASSILFNSTLCSFASSHLQSLGLPPNPSSPNPSNLSSSVPSTPQCDSLVHSKGPYGENLGIGCANPQECVDMWGNERDKYDFKKGEFSEETGHFTQLVWKDSKEMGCAPRWCESWNEGRGGWYLVCEFWPKGNIEGGFKDNVQKKGTYSAASGLRPVCGWEVVLLTGTVAAWFVLV